MNVKNFKKKFKSYDKENLTNSLTFLKINRNSKISGKISLSKQQFSSFYKSIRIYVNYDQTTTIYNCRPKHK